MSAPQFTPGPWFVFDDDSYMVGANREDASAIVADTDPIGSAPASDEECAANARLIAAAPELYEADGEALDTFVKLRADLAEEDAERHAQRIAVIDLEIERLTAARAKARGSDQ